MKKSYLLFSMLFVLTLFITSCKKEAKSWCPVGDPGDYLKVSENNKKTEPYELASGKAYYGKGLWSPVMTQKTEGIWYFKTGDAPVTVKYAYKVYNEKTQGVSVFYWYKTDTDHYITDKSGTVTFPANTLSYIEYSSGQVILGTDKKCFEFYLYCE